MICCAKNPCQVTFALRLRCPLRVRSAVAQIDPSHAGLRRNTYTHCRVLHYRNARTWYPSDHAQALRCARGKCFYTRLHGTIGESQGDYGEHYLLPLCDRLRQHSAGGGVSFVGLNNVGGEPPSAVVDAATIAARLNGP